VSFWTDLLGTFSTTFRIGKGKAILDASGLTAARTFTLPDASGTLSLGGGSSLNAKRLNPVAVLATTNQSLGSPVDIDGVSLVSNLRAAFSAQTDPEENGLWQYDSDTDAWIRPADFTSGIVSGCDFFVMDGTHAGELWRVTGTSAVVTDNLTLVKVPLVPAGGSDGQVLTKTSGSDFAIAWETPSGGGGVPDRSIFGYGDLGSVTITSNESFTEDKNYGDLTIDSAAVVSPASCIIRVQGTLSITNGTIEANGANGADGNSGGAGGAAQSFGSHPNYIPYIPNLAGTAGGNGGNGSSESYMETPYCFHNVGSGYHNGGQGGYGNGGSDPGYVGGSRAGHVRLPVPYHLITSDLRSIKIQFATMSFGASLFFSGMPGTGGGSGGGMGGGVGGGGGSCGGLIIIIAKTINIDSGGMISANGGSGGIGGDGTGGSNAGGGGGGAGGSGGTIILVYESLTGAGAASNVIAQGGSGGNGGSPDGSGGSSFAGEGGVAGTVIKYNLSTGAFE
jgi:hypothetical protein